MEKYTVQSGDTLNKIAQKFGYTNYQDAGISGYSSGNPDLIKPGEILSMKGKKVSTPSVVTSDVGKSKVTSMTDDINKSTQKGISIAGNTFDTSYDFGSLDSDINSVNKNIKNIMNGNYTMNNDEKLMLDGIRQAYDRTRRAQEDLNDRQEGGQTVLEARTGRARYAPELAQDNINYRIQKGLDKISEINLEEQVKLAEMRQSITDRKLKNANDQYDNLLDLRKERRDEMMDMNKFLLDITKEQRIQKNDELTRSAKLAKMRTGAAGLTTQQAIRYDLPQALVGKTERDIVEDLMVSKPPKWFIQSQVNATHLKDPNDYATAKAQWDTFRGDPDIKSFITSYQTNGLMKSEPKIGNNDDEDLY